MPRRFGGTIMIWRNSVADNTSILRAMHRSLASSFKKTGIRSLIAW